MSCLIKLLLLSALISGIIVGNYASAILALTCFALALNNDSLRRHNAWMHKQLIDARYGSFMRAVLHENQRRKKTDESSSRDAR